MISGAVVWLLADFPSSFEGRSEVHGHLNLEARLREVRHSDSITMYILCPIFNIIKRWSAYTQHYIFLVICPRLL